MTCASCGSITCHHSDPVYAGLTPSHAAAHPSTGSRPLAGDRHTFSVTGGFVDQFASDREADGLGGQVQGAGVHIHSATAKEARHHV